MQGVWCPNRPQCNLLQSKLVLLCRGLQTGSVLKQA
ncbi:unnamed protein product [Musa acuminata subsp. malaccensis]|uniref:(wild Malaysian banana) hypothetical protein n=1 Tax=Musa acuminata subsp. malaccensis TaxID=214687 RepID=A0A804JZ34_MUSAM|nr:unnamed protein product [Musa acuminata subsp. malaccensis]